ncbi:MAG: hypothetical protein M1818_001160 [Claussenomyces sp. TS43310]|nr:MAG: hypothetical protein M1818_001160 [Claussenomyces sp. TS43310]
MAQVNGFDAILYGKRLMPAVLDAEAAVHPTRIFAAIPNAADVSQGFRDVSFAEAANATNHVARWLRKTLGPATEREFETLTYIGIPDLRYSIIFYAAVKCGYKLLLPSPRNPVATNLSLMDQTLSTKLIYSKELAPLIEGIRAKRQGLNCMVIESLDEMLAALAQSFPYEKTFEEAVDDPVVVLHSSGSTGMPKPVVMTHGTFAATDNDRNFPGVEGRKNHDLTVWDFNGAPGRLYEPFPPFHLTGFFNKVMVPVFSHTIPVYGPPLRPPSGTLVAEILQQQDVRGSILPPVVVEQLLHEPDGLEYLKKLDVLCFAGGPLSQAAGDEIVKYTLLCQFYGSTEVGQVRQLVPVREDWSYMQFHPKSKLHFEPSEDGAFELVIYPDESTKSNMALNHNFPGLKQWRTKDLFRKHPTKPDLWRFHGRIDDIIVLSNGEKFYPVPMELALQASPIVAGAVVTGTGRFQPALIIEPKSDYQNDPMLLEKIWPAVEQANADTPGHGRVTKSMIIFSKPDKPFPRAGKGTVVRKLTEAGYADEIETLYSGQGEESAAAAAIAPVVLQASTFQPGAIRDFVRAIITQSLSRSDIKDEENFYSYGLDSLQTTTAVTSLKAGLRSQRDASRLSWISANLFYIYPSITELSDVVLAFLNKGEIPERKPRTSRMSAIYERFTQSLPDPGPAPSNLPSSGVLSVAVTGTTGSFGTRLLAELLRERPVPKIYCLNRSATAKQKWQSQAEAKGVDSSNVIFLTMDLTKPQLGLSNREFEDLSSNCDLLLHNAWKVDFNQSVSSFTDNIHSIPALIDFSAWSPRRPRIVFMSSISSVGPWVPAGHSPRIVPEEAVDDFDTAMDMGYAESKNIAERVLDTAAKSSRVPVSILRIGQISGSTIAGDTPWSTRELFPGIVQTSRVLGLVPSDLPPVDWIPIDKLSSIVLELAVHDLASSDASSSKAVYHNVVNPRKTAWSDLVGSIVAACGPEAKAVPLAAWVERLRQFDATDAEQLRSKPALKTLDFFAAVAARGPLVEFETRESERASQGLAALEAVDAALVELWL